MAYGTGGAGAERKRGGIGSNLAVIDNHLGPLQKARFVLADQVGLGKTLQLAMSAMLIALTGEKPILVICPKTLVWQWQGEMRDLLAMPSAVWDARKTRTRR